MKPFLVAIMLMTAVIMTACNPEDEPNNGGDDNGCAPKVITTLVSDITTNSARCGGDVIDDGGACVTDRGICWSINHKPTVNDAHVNCGSGMGSFVADMTDLLENTCYYVRAFATNSVGTSYGEEESFQTKENIPIIYTVEVMVSPINVGGEVSGGGSYEQGQSCTITAMKHDGYAFMYWTENENPVSSEESYTFLVTDNHVFVAHFIREYVDLGLPSGTLWATCNVGATTPEGYGDYYAWGEITPKDYYGWETYKYSGYWHGQYDRLTKYCNNPDYGYDGFVDQLWFLEADDDAATFYWGAGWSIPSKEQWNELRRSTSNEWINQNGVDGMLFTASNGNSVFLPAAGFRQYYELCSIDNGSYGSNQLLYNEPCTMCFFGFDQYGSNNGVSPRCFGFTIRPVHIPF